MARPKSAQRFIRKNITLPADFEEKLARLREASGSVSDSELIRQALNRLERALDQVEQEEAAARSSVAPRPKIRTHA